MDHHDAAVARYVARESEREDCLAVVLSGSLARGTERPDSDVDVYLVVTEERWDDAYARRRLMYVEDDGIGYPGGYYDVKLSTLSYLHDAAERGDDPVRDSFTTARIAFSRVPDLGERIARIGVLPEERWLERVRSFLAQARLYGGYFLGQACDSGDVLLLHHSSVHLATSAGRALLAAEHTFFAGQKYLMMQLRGLRCAPAGFADAVERLLENPAKDSGAVVLEQLESAVGPVLPRDETLSTFVLDNELAWRYRTLPPEYS